MKTIKDYYFKSLHDENMRLMSGLPLPDPADGPYKFVHCDFHPRVWEALEQGYALAEYVNCNWCPANRQF